MSTAVSEIGLARSGGGTARRGIKGRRCGIAGFMHHRRPDLEGHVAGR